ncbi:MAG: T9SS type A sorting domain-containing protein [Bacteroidota bacterium]|nr:T9SS type A sorting domain-containing protein [Bacteroidota bacterium]
MFYQYASLASNADSTGKITVTNGQLFDKFVNGVWQNPYLQNTVVGLAPPLSTYRGKNFKMLLPANLWYTNSASLVSQIQVDAADGLGYRTITPGTNLAVSYADTGMKVLNFKLFLTNSTILQSHTQLHVLQDPLALITGPPNGSGPVDGHGVTSSPTPGFYFVTSTSSYQGRLANGFVTIKLAPGHNTFTKPLIVVEGFDPGIYTNPETLTGIYSFDDFISSIVNSKSANLNQLLTDPNIAQYDIVFIDFQNGTDDIHRNALIVEDVIRWVNANKTGANKISVLGLSMGGLCTRYALKMMENSGETHNVGLFISHGVPEQGVAVPLGYQYLENHLNNLYVKAGPAIDTYTAIQIMLNPIPFILGQNQGPDLAGELTLSHTPAARQMLINRVNSSFQIDNSVHNAWQTELTSLGYPTQGNIRNIAISNGSECGQTQTLTEGGQLLAIDGRLHTTFLGDLVGAVAFPLLGRLADLPALRFGSVPGRNDIFLHFQVNAGVSGGGNQAYTGNISFRKTILWLIPVSVTVTNRTFATPSGVLPYETFAGDFYDVTPFIKSSQSNGSVGWLAKYKITVNVTPTFGFGPTPSVLDIGKGSVTLLASDYSIPYSEGSPPPAPKNTPFANFITAYSPLTSTKVNNNEGHITYETRNGNWLASELGGGSPLADCNILCQLNAITGDQYNCNSLKTYSVPTYSNVSYTWNPGPYFQIVGRNDQPSVQVQPLAGTNGQQGTISVDMKISNQPDCGTQTITRTINIGVEPLVVTSTVDRTPQQSNYQYLTATATQLAGTTPGNYKWYLTNSSGQVQYQIGNGLQLTNYPIAPCSTIYYQCQAVTPCGTAIYNGYAYNTTCGGGGYARTNQAVVIYPNPASTSMTVTNNKIPAATDPSGNPNGNVPQSYQVKVYDDKGKIIKSAQNEHGSPDVTVSTADMPNGNYFLHIIQGSNVIEKQVMIRH